MENENKNIDLIDKFIENERKSKWWTIISVSLFLLMAALVLFFTRKLSATKEKLTVSQQKLFDALDSLNMLKESIQQAKDSVDQINFSLEVSSDENTSMIDSLEKINDTLTVLLNTTQKMFLTQNTVAAGKKIDTLFQKAFPGKDKNAPDRIKESILKSDKIKIITPPAPVIYIQYMPDYKELCSKIRVQLLKDKTLKVESPEQISKTTFDPTVKYFHEEDRATAEKITKELNQFFKSELKKPFISQKIGLKSEHHQLEIWIGEYKKQQFLQHIDFYEIKKDTLKPTIIKRSNE